MAEQTYPGVAFGPTNIIPANCLPGGLFSGCDQKMIGPAQVSMQQVYASLPAAGKRVVKASAYQGRITGRDVWDAKQNFSK